MKKLLLTLLFIGIFQNTKAQTTESKTVVLDENIIHNSAGVEIRPEFKGGISEFYKYISKNYRTPNVPGLNGKIFLSFVIEKDGTINDVRVLKDIGYGCGEEAIRVLKNCPAWIPAEQNGKKVRCSYMLPISIQTPK